MKIVTSVVNNPEFIKIQHHTLKKFMNCDYEFIVFNDCKDFEDFTNSKNIHLKQIIEDTCKELNIKCINIPNKHHRELRDAAKRCADSMNFILKYQKENPDKYLIIDSDMFLIDYFDINEFKEYECAIVLQKRRNTEYFWNGIYYFDFLKIKNTERLNWNSNSICDSGGMMSKWLKLQRKNNTKMYFIKHLSSCSWNKDELPDNLKNDKLLEFFENDPRNENNKYFCEIYYNKFLHYRAGGNWRKEGMNLHNQLTQKLKDILIT